MKFHQICGGPKIRLKQPDLIKIDFYFDILFSENYTSENSKQKFAFAFNFQAVTFSNGYYSFSAVLDIFVGYKF